MNMRVMRRPASDSLTKSNSSELRNLEQERDCTLSNTLQFETAKTRAKCSTAFYWRGKGEVRNQTTAQVGLSNIKTTGNVATLPWTEYQPIADYPQHLPRFPTVCSYHLYLRLIKRRNSCSKGRITLSDG